MAGDAAWGGFLVGFGYFFFLVSMYVSRWEESRGCVQRALGQRRKWYPIDGASIVQIRPVSDFSYVSTPSTHTLSSSLTEDRLQNCHGFDNDLKHNKFSPLTVHWFTPQIKVMPKMHSLTLASQRNALSY